MVNKVEYIYNVIFLLIDARMRKMSPQQVMDE